MSESIKPRAESRPSLQGDVVERVSDALMEARRLCGQVPVDLSSAHAEICKLQGLDPATHTWPEWTPQANTLRWLDRLIPVIDEARAAMDACGWRPIAEAPKDGTPIMIANARGTIFSPCVWQPSGVISEEGFWLVWRATDFDEIAEPKAWQHLPSPPSEQEEG